MAEFLTQFSDAQILASIFVMTCFYYFERWGFELLDRALKIDYHTRPMATKRKDL